MISLIALMALLAFLLTIAAAAGKAPLWPAVFLLCVIEMMQVWR